MTEVDISAFTVYKCWCQLNNLKPSNPDSLKAYLRYLREEC